MTHRFIKNGIVFLTIATFMVSSIAFAEVKFYGCLEIDTDYVQKTTDNGSNPDTEETAFDQAGWVKLAATNRKDLDNLFFETKAEVLAKIDGTVAVDDAWGKMGNSMVDIQIGRFEGWCFYELGQDVFIVDAPNGPGRYEVNFARGRRNESGQIALHIFPNEIFGFELGTVYGSEVQNVYGPNSSPAAAITTSDVEFNYIGVRPVVGLTLNNFIALAGFDYLSGTPQNDDLKDEDNRMGYGILLKAVFEPVTFCLNYASGTKDGKEYSDSGALGDKAETTTTTYGGYCNLNIGKDTLGVGFNMTNEEIKNNPAESDHMQYFVSYAHPLPIEGAILKFGVSMAQATQEQSGVSDLEHDAIGCRMRINYYF